ncbi:hypothetical protein [Flagellimonas lutaonensis]|uniref:Competence protein n=1 Tax=Flagellimonas lutaonensis TaxID=516051 RepID=A0A0D5YQM0_9FLAO|nr:hypothetical protein [Allomuricauda lutaonensis]AKA34224.1 hypothetical protein VC82_550 [Allomuricauda lutaonensis]
MAFEELKSDLMEAEADMRSYLKHSEEYIELKIFQVFMKSVASLAQTLLVGATVFLALLLLSFAAAFGLGQLLQNTFHGFLMVGGFYVLVALLCYLFRNRLNGPLLRRFSEFYFD